MDNHHEGLAASYALGILSQVDRSQVEEQMKKDAAFAQAVGEWVYRFAPLLSESDAVEPPADVFAKIEEAIARQTASGAHASVTIRADEGRWIKIAPGARKKFLYFDEQARSEAFLIELDAGASLPDHDHNATEDCLVMSGDFIIGDLKLKAGDFHAAFTASRHAPCRSQTGCRLFIKAAA